MTLMQLNDQSIALLIAMLIGLVPNIILKLLDKYKSKEEVADIEVDSLTQTLESMRDHNKFLEEKVTSKREEITLQNKMLYDLNSQNAVLTKQISDLTVQLLDITAKLQDCIKCIEKLKEENGNAQET